MHDVHLHSAVDNAASFQSLFIGKVELEVKAVAACEIRTAESTDLNADQTKTAL